MLSKHDLVLRKILADVQRPSRYIGAEWNHVEKSASRASIALAYPDVYEVGMSNLGLQILYDVINRHKSYRCERVFAPWPDMEEQMLENDLPLFTLESKKYVKKDFDIFGFSLQYELTFTNVLKMLTLASIPLRAEERDETCPLVIGGGPCVFNPEPMAPFFDLFVIGEAEEAIIEILDIIADQKEAGLSRSSREETIDRLSKLKSVYVPSIAKGAIRKRCLSNFSGYSVPTAPVVPFMETIHDRCVIEVMRGCTRGCRFCQAGIIYRPTRERAAQKVVDGAATQSRSTGHEDVSLASLSTTDHSQITEMLNGLMELSTSPGASVSLPSLRCDQFSVDVAERIATKKKRGLTFAPEAGTARLRKVINKG
ncbi:MAG TPA: B12-binding domain-containing radical SAM protein, partial [Actinobacteria bacterium]|nr:B12-binding domain-containing radical SAM protein [Actinomycetota bacterium]